MATSAVFFAVGSKLLSRHVEGDARRANLSFAAWWWCLAVYLLMQGAFTLAAAAGVTSYTVSIAARYVYGPLLCGAAGALAYHILYLYTGRTGIGWVIGFYYAAAALAYDVSAFAAGAQAVVVGDWEVGLRPAPTGPLWSAVLASIGVPMIVGSIAYLSLVRHVRERAQRYRIILVSVRILLWVSSGLAAQIGGGPFLRFFTVVVVGLAAALAVLGAYFPPRSVQRWLARPPAVAGHSP